MKNPKLKLFIIPLVMFLISYVFFMYISVEMYEDTHWGDVIGFLLFFIIVPIMSLVPTVIYYSFYIAYKKISKMVDKDEKISDKDKIEAAKLDMLLRAHKNVMGNIDNK